MANLMAVTDGEFESQVLQADMPVLVDFWAEWCGPCKMIAPMVEELSQEYDGQVRFTKMDVDSNPMTAASLGIRSIPTLLIFRGGKPWSRWWAQSPRPCSRSGWSLRWRRASHHPRPGSEWGPVALAVFKNRRVRGERIGGFDSLSLPPCCVHAGLH